MTVHPIRRPPDLKPERDAGGTMCSRETAKFLINEDYPSARRWPGDEASGHPRWCRREWCTAYEPDEEIEPRYHRSKPYMIETEDRNVVLTVHLGARSDGSDPYV